MNIISPKKLVHSKWTAVQPSNREKHFMVVAVLRDDNQIVQRCVIEAVHSGRQTELDWRKLKDDTRWRLGWT